MNEKYSIIEILDDFETNDKMLNFSAEVFK